MRPGFLSIAYSRDRVSLAVLSAVVLTISVAVSVLLWRSQTEKTAPAADVTQPVLELQFKDANGASLTLADFRGRAVLLNVWATWCGPCRREMPSLDRLQARLGGPEFSVVALSIDSSGLGAVQPFFDEIGVESLTIYLDESAAAMRALGITGVPTTLLIDRDGRETRRWAGPAEWDSPEMETLIQRQLAIATSFDSNSRHPTGR